jgi:hypothetical protein
MLLKDGVRTKRKSNRTRYEVGAKVRATIPDLGGTMPEQLPRQRKAFSRWGRTKTRDSHLQKSSIKAGLKPYRGHPRYGRSFPIFSKGFLCPYPPNLSLVLPISASPSILRWVSL